MVSFPMKMEDAVDESADYSGLNRRLGLWSMVDQGAVSATNFLTIVIGAYLLALPEQTKLVYLYTVYIGLVLFNAAAIFSAAPMVNHESENPFAYQRQLLVAQSWIAPILAFLVASVFLLIGPLLEWSPTIGELGWVALFLTLQQFADFNRRADYIFGVVKSGALSSLSILVVRLILLLTIQPEDAATFFMLMALSAFPGALLALKRWGSAADIDSPGSYFSEHIHLSRWNIMNAPLQWIALHLPILLAGMLIGGSSAAILATIRSISTAANVFMELMETYVPVWMLRQAGNHGVEGLNRPVLKLFWVGIIGWILLAVVAFFFGETLLEELIGSVYAPYWPLLLLLWLGNGIYFVGRLIGLRYRVARLPKIEFIGSVGGVIMLLGALSLFWDKGIYAIAGMIVLSQVGVVVFQILWGRRVLKK